MRSLFLLPLLLGFSLPAIAESKTYKINGMHCASCVSSVENIINKIDGVNSAIVNLTLETVKAFFVNFGALFCNVFIRFQYLREYLETQ